MLDKAFADHFAADWIESWNSHDLNRILAHYSDDFTMSSPLIARIAGEPSGTLQSKKEVGAYWSKGLQLFPDLRFELVATLVGSDSIVISYNGPRGLSAEVFIFDSSRKVVRAFAHYCEPPKN